MVDVNLSYDDVLLSPRRSAVHSRRDISLRTFLALDYPLDCPIVSANMPSVTGPVLAFQMYLYGGFGILPRFNTIREAVSDFYDVREKGADCGVSIGVGEDYQDRVKALYEAGARIFCIDVAHGHHDRVIGAIEWVKNFSPTSFVIAGNVATTTGAYDLAQAGADTIKVGIGPGAACTTREVTGFGIPQLGAILAAAQIKSDFPEVCIMADGGIKNSGDIVKSLNFGADTVMLGRLFAGTREAPFPGEYFGNASSRIRDYNAPEGVAGSIETGSTVEEVMKNLKWGIKSGLSYAGVSDIYDLHEDPVEFMVVSSQTMNETRTRI